MLGDLIQVTLCDVDPARQQEFNRWYNEVHIPEVLTCPGWLSATRFESTQGQPQFLAIYELENEGAWTTPEFERVKGFGPVAPYVINVHPRTYRRTFGMRAGDA
jgi:hypothetical protein